MRRFCVTLVFLGLALAGGAVPRLAAQGKEAKATRLPGDARWETPAWLDDFRVVSVAYDPARRQVTWTLEASRKAEAWRYRAHFYDPDFLEMTPPLKVALTPALAEYPKGSRLQATLKVPGKDVLQEVNRVVIEKDGRVTPR